MTPRSVWEYVDTIRSRYHQVSWIEKSRKLLEGCRVTGYHRKSVIRGKGGDEATVAGRSKPRPQAAWPALDS